MDNASIHHVENVYKLIEEQAGAKLIYLPPYSRDLNPVEEVFGQVKSVMRQIDLLFQVSNTPGILLHGIVSQEDCLMYIEHSGFK